MAINALWHAEHPAPRSQFTELRSEWHLEHQKRCGCRPMPPKLAAAERRRAASLRGRAKKKASLKGKSSRAKARRS